MAESAKQPQNPSTSLSLLPQRHFCKSALASRRDMLAPCFVSASVGRLRAVPRVGKPLPGDSASRAQLQRQGVRACAAPSLAGVWASRRPFYQARRRLILRPAGRCRLCGRVARMAVAPRGGCKHWLRFGDSDKKGPSSVPLVPRAPGGNTGFFPLPGPADCG